MTPSGSLAIEFTRTLTTERDRLPDYGALVDWAERSGVASGAVAAGLRARAREHPRRAADVHREAVALRHAIDRILRAASAGNDPESEHLATLNRMLHRAAPYHILVGAAGGCEWSWTEDVSGELESPLWAVAQDAADLLTSEWVERLGVCAADTCRWLFIDESRNRSRRWCDMSDCGTRAKVRRFRARAKGKKSA